MVLDFTKLGLVSGKVVSVVEGNRRVTSNRMAGMQAQMIATWASTSDHRLGSNSSPIHVS